MSVAVRLGAFAALLALVLAGGFGLGRAVGPVGGSAGAPASEDGMDRSDMTEGDMTEGDMTEGAARGAEEARA